MPEDYQPMHGPFRDAMYGWGAGPVEQVFGGLSDNIPVAQQAGSNIRDMAAQGTGYGYGALMDLAQRAFGPVGQTQGIAGMAPDAMEASNYYLQGVTGAAKGSNVQGAMGAGQQVVDKALAAYQAMPAEAYQRVVAEGLPEVRASYSSRGLGASGGAARGEQDYIQRTRDQLYQQDVANQIAALQSGAAASGAAASQAIGAQQAALGRGQLGLAASQAPGQILGQFQQVATSPLDAMIAAAGLQSQPLQLAGAGGQVYSQGLNLPLEYQQAIYEFTRDPAKTIMGALSGVQQNSSKGQYRTIGGIPK
jgi:hypothetical protein